MSTDGLWGIISLAAFVLITVLLFKFVTNMLGAHRIAALV